MKLQSFAFSALFLSAVVGHAATVGFWKFDAGPAGVGATTIPDSSGNGVTATANNGPLFSSSVPNGSGHSIALDGSSQTVTIPAATGPLASAGSFTVEFWMRSGVVDASFDLLVDKSHGFADSTGWVFQANPNSGNVVFAVGGGGGGSGNFPGIGSISSLYDGNWHHLAGTYNSGSGQIEFFVDGVSQGTTPVNYVANTRDIRIGNTWQSTRFFGGNIDELRISNQVLSPSEFLNIPEPSVAVLSVLGLLGLARRRR